MVIIIESAYYQVTQIEIDKRLILYQIQSTCKIQVMELVRKQWQKILEDKDLNMIIQHNPTKNEILLLPNRLLTPMLENIPYCINNLSSWGRTHEVRNLLETSEITY